MSDHILVMHEGHLNGAFPIEQITPRSIDGCGHQQAIRRKAGVIRYEFPDCRKVLV